MKKTLTINISGTVFHIDDDAYEKLKIYLTKLSSHFSKEEGGHEIINDIESRISELFNEKTNNNQNVVHSQMVEEVIETMGLPEDFVDDEAETTEKDSSNNNFQPPYVKSSKRLYRDPDSRVIGGVCSGLSYYLNMDKALTRILFVVLFLITSGIASFAYLLLWIAVPKARSISQKLEMKGENVNVDSIGNAVKEEFNEMKDTYNRYTNSEDYIRNKQYAKNVGKDTANVLVKIFGAIFLFIGFISFVSVTLALLAASNLIGFLPDFLPGGPNGMFVHHIFDGSLTTTLLISTFIITCIPLLLLIYAGSKMLFNFRSDNRTIMFSALGIWIAGIIIAVGTSLGAADVFSTNASVTDKFELQTTADTIYINIDETNFENMEETRYEINNTLVMMQNDKEVLVSRPDFTIEQTSNEMPELRIRKSARGNKYKNAKENAENISYNYNNVGANLLLDPYFTITEDGKWRSQEVKIKLKLPKGKVVYLHEDLLPIIYDIENTTNTWDGDMVGEYWEMKPQGLTLIK